jgi:hypothetical protein
MTQENTVQKKGNSKILVFALIAIALILTGSLVGVIAIYSPIDSQLTAKDKTINDLHAQISNLESQMDNSTGNSQTNQAYISQISQLNQELLDLNDSYTTAASDATSFNSIIQMQESGLLYSTATTGPITQDANSTTTLWNDQLDYAGYVVVQASANATSTYAQAIYTYSGYNFNLNQTIGTSGTAIFAVLPGAVEINLGNMNETSANTVTATVTYYY